MQADLKFRQDVLQETEKCLYLLYEKIENTDGLCTLYKSSILDMLKQITQMQSKGLIGKIGVISFI